MQEQNPIVLMNFSGIYREEEFWKNRQVSWIELQDVCGTNCYCDEEAIAEINKRTENYPTAGIHFIDSGNYHYMTRLWLTRMDQPFCLLVYDNHTDMQPPAFGGDFVVWRMDRGSVGGTGESEICDPCGTG